MAGLSSRGGVAGGGVEALAHPGEISDQLDLPDEQADDNETSVVAQLLDHQVGPARQTAQRACS